MTRIMRVHPWVLLLALTCGLWASNARAYYILSVTDKSLYAPAFVADKLGFWKELGLDIRVGQVAESDEAFNLIRARFTLNGRNCVDVFPCRVGDLAWQQANGLGLVPVAVIGGDAGYVQLIMRENLATLKDLKGATIACDYHTANLLFLRDVLKHEGLSLDDVSLLDLAGVSNPRPFLQGQADAIVIAGDGAAECVTKGKGKIAATGKEFPDALKEVLCVKDWLLKKEPEMMAQKLVQGYARAQVWVMDAKNLPALTEILDASSYFLKWQEDAKPLAAETVSGKLKEFALTEPAAPDVALQQFLEQSKTFLLDRERLYHEGRVGAQPAPARRKTGAAFDDAHAWWKFERERDYRSYGSGGALNLTARGPCADMKLYGVIAQDYYHSTPVAVAGGFLNDGYGWATDGIPKYVAAEQPLALSGDFTVWMRCSNRNTMDTVLLQEGVTTGPEGFSLAYHRGDKPWFGFIIHPNRRNPLKLEGIPVGTFLDCCVSYEAKTGTLRGWVYDPKSGKLVTTATLQVQPDSYHPAAVPATIGADRDGNAPLHGNIESCAVWKRVLSADEVEQLTVGPKAPDAKPITARDFHNVMDFGAVGDGKTDDTQAIQDAIDACVFATEERMFRMRKPPKPGFTNGGVVFVPRGVYRTTRSLLLRPMVSVIGDAGTVPVIMSEADAAVVWWADEWNDRPLDFKVRPLHNTAGVTLENLRVIGKRFGGHTMGTSANGVRMRHCQWEGAEAGLAVTGFMMFSEIRDCRFHESLWILCKQGTRFNTTIVENIVVGLHGTRYDKWAVRLEGCIQCVQINGVTFEVRGKGILLDANAAGATIDLQNIWNYDTAGSSEVLRIVNGEGVSVRNIMGLDEPSTIFIGKNVRNIRMENILAKSITVEDAAATKPILSNIRCELSAAAGSLIEDDQGGTKQNIK